MNATTQRLRELLEEASARNARLDLGKASDGSTRGAWWVEAIADDPEVERFADIVSACLNALPALLDRLDRAEALLHEAKNALGPRLVGYRTDLTLDINAFLAEQP